MPLWIYLLVALAAVIWLGLCSEVVFWSRYHPRTAPRRPSLPRADVPTAPPVAVRRQIAGSGRGSRIVAWSKRPVNQSAVVG